MPSRGSRCVRTRRVRVSRADRWSLARAARTVKSPIGETAPGAAGQASGRGPARCLARRALSLATVGDATPRRAGRVGSERGGQARRPGRGAVGRPRPRRDRRDGSPGARRVARGEAAAGGWRTGGGRRRATHGRPAHGPWRRGGRSPPVPRSTPDGGAAGAAAWCAVQLTRCSTRAATASRVTAPGTGRWAASPALRCTTIAPAK